MKQAPGSEKISNRILRCSTRKAVVALPNIINSKLKEKPLIRTLIAERLIARSIQDHSREEGIFLQKNNFDSDTNMHTIDGIHR